VTLISDHPEVAAIDERLDKVRTAKSLLVERAQEVRVRDDEDRAVWETECGAAARENRSPPAALPPLDGSAHDVALAHLKADEDWLKQARFEAVVAALPEIEEQAEHRLSELQAKAFPVAKKLLDLRGEVNGLLADVQQAREFSERGSGLESYARAAYRTRSNLTPVDWFEAVIGSDDLMALTELPVRRGEILNDSQPPTFDDSAPPNVLKMQTSGLGERPEEMPRQARSSRGVEI
jgi:hypothetical protein